jgi:hypothetical protein
LLFLAWSSLRRESCPIDFGNDRMRLSVIRSSSKLDMPETHSGNASNAFSLMLR